MFSKNLNLLFQMDHSSTHPHLILCWIRLYVYLQSPLSNSRLAQLTAMHCMQERKKAKFSKMYLFISAIFIMLT